MLTIIYLVFQSNLGRSACNVYHSVGRGLTKNPSLKYICAEIEGHSEYLRAILIFKLPGRTRHIFYISNYLDLHETFYLDVQISSSPKQSPNSFIKASEQFLNSDNSQVICIADSNVKGVHAIECNFFAAFSIISFVSSLPFCFCFAAEEPFKIT